MVLARYSWSWLVFHDLGISVMVHRATNGTDVQHLVHLGRPSHCRFAPARVPAPLAEEEQTPAYGVPRRGRGVVTGTGSGRAFRNNTILQTFYFILMPHPG